ncbi:MAG: AI-2E family transporter [Proteobacteria bacterium]|nr:AI-2E family transporter [Desulfocapsa sp.]MBU3946372.1 AI-2E family transporter [Pseudomonadota bacterium]MBU3982243.1 AI-2E family transporter [Pseudomonadota bacterium]MBU4027653.1 AI-2E family transporter [Pseudomonadota bacterium]MBU4043063.1 AI-2E family transporter [Pseudomonadota bacterium]
MKKKANPGAGNPSPVEQISEISHPLILHVPVDARGLALGILATIALVFALEWMQTFFVPLLLGIFLSYTLTPLVVWLERIKMPRVLGTSLVMMAVVCVLVLGTYSLRGQMQTILVQLPEAASKLSAGFASMRADLSLSGNMQKVQTAVGEMEKATSQMTSIPPGRKQQTAHVVIDTPGFKLGDFMWAGSMGALGFIGQATMVIFLAFFLLVGGNTFKRKLVRLTGPSLSRKKITVKILNDINGSIQKYLFMLLLTNLLLGLLTWIAFHWISLENAGAWAVAAGLLHVIPYVGPTLTAVAIGMAAYMQFDSFPMALLVLGVSLVIAMVVGTFVTTCMTGKNAKMNAAAVFISLLFLGWLWGVWGMLLGIPIIVIMKVISHHVEQMQPVAELLGE